MQTLVLQGNRMTQLPDSFGQLAALETVDSSRNELAHLPSNFGRLISLQTLELRYNKLTRLPDSFGHLAALRTLDLESNELTDLPETFGQLTALEVLDLFKNKLTSLPGSFGHLVSLESLLVRGNQLACLPANFTKLRLSIFTLVELWASEWRCNNGARSVLQQMIIARVASWCVCVVVDAGQTDCVQMSMLHGGHGHVPVSGEFSTTALRMATAIVIHVRCGIE
eukprot:TRINITY_DN78460_c0_g1_i1.p1 TRINITY_DN78460_c0_g1~~TRINITY_DN78460_c0_g1_i1.p1  ORF type:complete len:247 (-),score=19.93 TRINITY_DN78460_c0_g1_i1:320-994(-)